MPEITGYTKDGVDDLFAAAIVGAYIDSSGELFVTTSGGTNIPVGSVLSTVPFASETQSGVLTISTEAQVTAGTDNTSAISPLKLGEQLAVKQKVTQLNASGSTYAAATGSAIYVGLTDPGAVPNGSIWIDLNT